MKLPLLTKETMSIKGQDLLEKIRHDFIGLDTEYETVDGNKSRRIYYFTYNKKSEGNHRLGYFDKKRELFPQDADKIPGKDYSLLGAKYNLGNPINSKV